MYSPKKRIHFKQNRGITPRNNVSEELSWKALEKLKERRRTAKSWISLYIQG